MIRYTKEYIEQCRTPRITDQIRIKINGKFISINNRTSWCKIGSAKICLCNNVKNFVRCSKRFDIYSYKERIAICNSVYEELLNFVEFVHT